MWAHLKRGTTASMRGRSAGTGANYSRSYAAAPDEGRDRERVSAARERTRLRGRVGRLRAPAPGAAPLAVRAAARLGLPHLLDRRPPDGPGRGRPGGVLGLLRRAPGALPLEWRAARGAAQR